jgi:hypothetical protein
MANERPPIRGRGGQIHPLFAELYLSGDDSDEADSKRRAARKRARARQIASVKLVNRRG